MVGSCPPRTKNAIREIDIDSGLAETLNQYIGGKQAGRVFEARNGSPISGNNVLKRVLHPLLKRLGIPRAGLHAFRHSRVTMLRANGTPEDLQKQWIGHSSLRTTDRYSHTNQELEYRRLAASKAGLSFTVGPNGPWYRLFEINMMSGVRLSRHYLAGMLKQNSGRILFISSESGVQIPAEMVHYGMTKTAQIAVARGIAESVAGTGVTVNSILAGPTESEGVGAFVEAMARQENKTKAEIETQFFEHVRPSSLLKRFATVSEVAALATYVASEISSATNGAALRVDGGVVRAIL